jgi:hypothetical protein
MKYASEFITEGVLVSAYDVHYGFISPRKITFPSIIFLDSGGCEARVEHDLSEVYSRPYKPKSWTERSHEKVLREWASNIPTVIVSHDGPKQFLPLKRQIKKPDS